MNMQARETEAQATPREPSVWSKVLVALIVAVVVAIVTVVAIRYFTRCGDCSGPPPVRQHDI